MKYPKYIMRFVLSSLKGDELYNWPGFYRVPDNAQEWLTEHLGITSDCNETVELFGTFRFHWNTEKWFFSAASDDDILLWMAHNDCKSVMNTMYSRKYNCEDLF